MIALSAPSIYPCPHGAVKHKTDTNADSIPPITDPQGASWRGPDLTKLDISREFVELTQREFEALPEYSTTRPTGVYPGKCWKGEGMKQGANGWPVGNGIWYLRWYGIVTENPNVCSNNERLIRFINPRKEEAK